MTTTNTNDFTARAEKIAESESALEVDLMAALPYQVYDALRVVWQNRKDAQYEGLLTPHATGTPEYEEFCAARETLQQWIDQNGMQGLSAENLAFCLYHERGYNLARYLQTARCQRELDAE